MSAFYGTVRGAARTEANRRGHREITVAARSWVGSVVVTLDGSATDPVVTLQVAEGSTANGGRTVYCAAMSELMKAEALCGTSG